MPDGATMFFRIVGAAGKMAAANRSKLLRVVVSKTFEVPSSSATRSQRTLSLTDNLREVTMDVSGLPGSRWNCSQ